MSFLFRLKLLHLIIKVLFPDRHHPVMPMGSTPVRKFVRPPGGVPDFVDDLTDDEIGACDAAFQDAWKEALDDADVIANTRNFLIRQWERQS